jgi:biotin synthase-like enzyme
MSHGGHTYTCANKSEAQLCVYCAQSAAMMTCRGDAEAIETAEGVEAAKAAEDAGAADARSSDDDL